MGPSSSMFACYRIRLQLAWNAEKGAPLDASLEGHLVSCPACRTRVNNRRRLEMCMTAASPLRAPSQYQHRAPSNLAARVRHELESASASVPRAAAAESQPGLFHGWTQRGATTVVFATLGLAATAALVRWEMHRAPGQEPQTASGPATAHVHTSLANVDPMGWLHAAMTQASLPLPKGADLLTIGSNLGTPLEEEWHRVVKDATNTAVFLAKSWMPNLADSR